MDIFMCNVKLLKTLFACLGIYSTLIFATEIPNKNKKTYFVLLFEFIVKKMAVATLKAVIVCPDGIAL